MQTFWHKLAVISQLFDEKIERAKEDNLKNTFYHKINVRDQEDIVKSFKKTNSKFDIIIDDSTHDFEDQINIITHCNQFLEKNGILIIEHDKRIKFDEKNTDVRKYGNVFFTMFNL